MTKKRKRISTKKRYWLLDEDVLIEDGDEYSDADAEKWRPVTADYIDITVGDSDYDRVRRAMKGRKQDRHEETRGASDSERLFSNLVRRATRGEADAQFSLGVCYANGTDVVEKDEEEAVRWYRKAAEQGDALAQCYLALCYASGVGIAKNEREAARWFRKAAEQGDATAQFNLGVCYMHGKGVQKSFAEAYKWFNVAAAQGDENAAKSRDELENKMSESDISHAQRLSTEFVERLES
jgi:Sel1 repeat